MSAQWVSYRGIWYRPPHGRPDIGDHILYIVYLVSGLTLSMSQPCLHNGSPIYGIDLHMADLVQEITYYILFIWFQVLLLSMSQPCLHNGSPIGVSSIDLHMADLVQEITFYILFIRFQVLH